MASCSPCSARTGPARPRPWRSSRATGRADGGTVRVLGLDPAADRRRLRSRVGLMLQEGGIDPRTTPREALRLYARLFRDPEDPDALLELVDLGRAATTRYRRLSGGEKQRLGLALALVGRPELLVLDEPTAGMDPAAKQATRDRIAALRAAGTTILLTTHELGDVERLADRVAVLDRGRIVAEGTPAELTGAGPPRVRFRARPRRSTRPTRAALAASARCRRRGRPVGRGGVVRGPRARRRRPIRAWSRRSPHGARRAGCCSPSCGSVRRASRSATSSSSAARRSTPTAPDRTREHAARDPADGRRHTCHAGVMAADGHGADGPRAPARPAARREPAGQLRDPGGRPARVQRVRPGRR